MTEIDTTEQLQDALGTISALLTQARDASKGIEAMQFAQAAQNTAQIMYALLEVQQKSRAPNKI